MVNFLMNMKRSKRNAYIFWYPRNHGKVSIITHTISTQNISERLNIEMKPLLTLILMYLAISATQETGVLKHNLDCQQNPETGNCFFSVDAKNSNYENAVKTCKEKGGFLPILLYPSDLKFTKKTFQFKNQEYWIGLKRSHPDGCHSIFEDCVNKLEWYNSLDSQSLSFHQQLCSIPYPTDVKITYFASPNHKCAGINPLISTMCS